MKKLMILCLCISIILSYSLSGHVNAAPGKPLKEKFDIDEKFGQGTRVDELLRQPYYSSILKVYEEKGYAAVENTEITLKATESVKSNKGDIPVKTGLYGKDEELLLWQEGYEWFEWEFDIPKTGLYEIEVEYYPVPGGGSPIRRSLAIDGQITFEEANNIVFDRMWADDGEPKINNIGDEVRPRQKEIPQWDKVALTDSEGMYPGPFKFYFSEGTHIIRMNYIDQPVAFSRIIIRAPEEILSYEEVKKEYVQKNYSHGSDTTIFQSESTAILKSDPTLRRESDADPKTQPLSRGSRVLNVIGDYRWRKGNQSITWEFTVPESGLYKIGLRAGQWYTDGLPSYRQIAVNGKIPFAELKEYSFKFKHASWQTETLRDNNGEPFLFYLNEGKNTLTMTVKMGPIRDFIHSLTEDSILLSNLIYKITMITGSDPDLFFDYNLDNRIPDLIEKFEYFCDSLEEKARAMEDMSTKTPTWVHNKRSLIAAFKKMIEDPRSIAKKLNELVNAQSSLGSEILALKEQPLVIDYFTVGPEKEKWEHIKSNIFEKLYTTVYNFLRSFWVDYDSIGNVYEDSETETDSQGKNKEDGKDFGKNNKTNKLINIWTARGKEWGEIIKEMADETFTPKTGIAVNMNILPASQLNAGAVNALMLAIASGRAPDVASAVGATSPVEFAIRDAAANLMEFDDYDSVASRFLPGIMIPFEYNDGIYGLPETMGFRVLFYRKDIINELGIRLPDTWDDFYTHVLPVLNQHQMEFYYPADITTFLFQKGGSFYKENGMKSALDSPEAYQAIKEMSELYTSYGLPVAANFYNRMRTGEMPMGIEGYGMYMLLSVAAPELAGRWGIAPIPGTRKKDGTIDRSSGGVAGEAIVIMNQSPKKNESWEFLKWWTSTEVQAQFGKELEALVGPQARWNTANTEAFLSLPWDSKDLIVLREQWQWYKEMPVVLGGYFTGRHIANAWNRIIIGEMPVRDSVEKAVKDINRELKAKQQEYGIFIDE